MLSVLESGMVKPSRYLVMIVVATFYFALGCGFLRINGVGSTTSFVNMRRNMWTSSNQRVQIYSTSGDEMASAQGSKHGLNDYDSQLQSLGTDKFRRFAEFLLGTQEQICRQATTSDGKGVFCKDVWKRDEPSQVRTSFSARA